MAYLLLGPAWFPIAYEIEGVTFYSTNAVMNCDEDICSKCELFYSDPKTGIFASNNPSKLVFSSASQACAFLRLVVDEDFPAHIIMIGIFFKDSQQEEIYNCPKYSLDTTALLEKKETL